MRAKRFIVFWQCRLTVLLACLFFRVWEYLHWRAEQTDLTRQAIYVLPTYCGVLLYLLSPQPSLPGCLVTMSYQHNSPHTGLACLTSLSRVHHSHHNTPASQPQVCGEAEQQEIFLSSNWASCLLAWQLCSIAGTSVLAACADCVTSQLGGTPLLSYF